MGRLLGATLKRHGGSELCLFFELQLQVQTRAVRDENPYRLFEAVGGVSHGDRIHAGGDLVKLKLAGAAALQNVVKRPRLAKGAGSPSPSRTTGAERALCAVLGNPCQLRKAEL